VVRPVSLAPDRVRIRPLGAADRAPYAAFLEGLEAEDLYLRTMGRTARPDAARIGALLDLDGHTRLALAAVGADGTILGVARAAVDAVDASAEFALIVGSALKRKGLGAKLLRALLARLRALGVQRVFGHTFASNEALLGLVRKHGFAVAPGEDGTTRRVERSLEPAAV
jgi:ribosomal protein S18 acetylase RimI-like enzyme